MNANYLNLDVNISQNLKIKYLISRGNLYYRLWKFTCKEQ